VTPLKDEREKKKTEEKNQYDRIAAMHISRHPGQPKKNREGERLRWYTRGADEAGRAQQPRRISWGGTVKKSRGCPAGQ